MRALLTIDELAHDIVGVLERVRRGERMTIVRDGKSIAVLCPAQHRPGITLDELIAHIGDLGMPRDGFADDLEAIQASQPMAEFPEWRD